MSNKTKPRFSILYYFIKSPYKVTYEQAAFNERKYIHDFLVKLYIMFVIYFFLQNNPSAW